MSLEFKNKNDYSVTVFNEKKVMLKLYYVHNLYTCFKWLNDKNIEWTYFNVYARRTGRYLGRIYKNQMYIPKNLR